MGGCRGLAKACNLGSLGMLAWMVVLNWVGVWDYAFWYFFCYQQTVLIVFFVCVDGFFLFVLFNFHCALCSVSWEKMKCGLLSVDQWIYFYLIHIFSYFQFSKYLKRLEFMHWLNLSLMATTLLFCFSFWDICAILSNSRQKRMH